MKTTLLFFSGFFQVLALICVGFLAYNHFHEGLPEFAPVWMAGAGIFGSIGGGIALLAITGRFPGATNPQ